MEGLTIADWVRTQGVSVICDSIENQKSTIGNLKPLSNKRFY